MSTKLDNWRRHAPQHRAALERTLARNGRQALVIAYTQVARAFPAGVPDPVSPDEPRLDYRALIAWATPRRWTVQPEIHGQTHPPVRFVWQ